MTRSSGVCEIGDAPAYLISQSPFEAAGFSSLGAKVMNTTLIANIPHVTAEIGVEEGSELAGKRVEEIEQLHCCNILARTPSGSPIQLPPSAATMIHLGDVLVVHTPSSQLATVSAAARGAGVAV